MSVMHRLILARLHRRLPKSFLILLGALILAALISLLYLALRPNYYTAKKPSPTITGQNNASASTLTLDTPQPAAAALRVRPRVLAASVRTPRITPAIAPVQNQASTPEPTTDAAGTNATCLALGSLCTIAETENNTTNNTSESDNPSSLLTPAIPPLPTSTLPLSPSTGTDISIK
jgi:hypothetical protein